MVDIAASLHGFKNGDIFNIGLVRSEDNIADGLTKPMAQTSIPTIIHSGTHLPTRIIRQNNDQSAELLDNLALTVIPSFATSAPFFLKNRSNLHAQLLSPSFLPFQLRPNFTLETYITFKYLQPNFPPIYLLSRISSLTFFSL